MSYIPNDYDNLLDLPDTNPPPKWDGINEYLGRMREKYNEYYGIDLNHWKPSEYLIGYDPFIPEDKSEDIILLRRARCR